MVSLVNNFKHMSKNGIGVAVLVIEYALRSLNIEVPGGAVAEAINGLVVFGSFVLLIWNQLDRPNVHAFFFKK